MTTNLLIRPLLDTDTDGVVRLYDMASRVENGIGPITPAQWQGFVGRSRSVNGRDFRVALVGTDLIGLAESALRDQGSRLVRYIKLIVDPAFRRRGVGTQLLGSVLEQDSDETVSLHGHTQTSWSAGRAFAETKGFSIIESEYRMHCPSFDPSSDPVGETLVARVEEPSILAWRLAEIHNAAFREDVSFTRHTADDMLAKLEGMQLWSALLFGRTVGHAIVDPDPHSVWLESLAVDPKFQGRGIGRALVVCSLRGSMGRAASSAGLSVSSQNQIALRLYKRLGFEPVSEKLRYAASRRVLLTRSGHHSTQSRLRMTH
ncbi:GNAT family N-acetyltransferase [Aureimonas sp. D3]|uniref:GNAT family N-acetyltransferase n=1 Tax=Aureimonas sp. D3 TaxID=1638164 RepID=UPI000780C658|nr:GNAT family N-acetyltransferase [Aureimonas sp. D3]